MRVLLPPSEAKATGGDGPSLRTAGFGAGPLADARAEVVRAVTAFCRSKPNAAIAALRLPASRAQADLAANTAMLDAPTMPALDRFVGILYQALDPASLPAPARAAASHTLFVSHGAFGLLGAAEPVPDHRVAMTAAIPGLGGRGVSTVLAAFWRARLASALPDLLTGAPDDIGEHLVVDLRSSDYATVPSLTGPARANALPVRALTERLVDGRWVRRPLSYQAKQTKGLLTRALLLADTAGRPVKTIDDVAEVAESAGLVAEPRGTATAPTLDVITRWHPTT
ncbi:peroxide stress protein YaaA [Frankia sp. Ag45/Mut15]|uniref:Peroxide stress protein YaaA n=1 Tax=Frankia umida TaxID=573489 RepID=A0ABT0K5P2_9ACTN|nr:peroxide stress protein YaaA [Frankia umida]MCK9878814.1 peroxide stress protein YaaA [Frankia umida]